MKIKRHFALLSLCAILMMFVVLSHLMANSGQEEVLSALENTFDMIPEDGHIISAETLYNRMKSGKQDFVIVDTRPHIEDFETGHIPGALFIPWRDIVKADSLKKLPKGKDIILYCSTGHLENQALTALRTLGYKAYALRWGMMSWAETRHTDQALEQINKAKKSGYPVEKGMNAKIREEYKIRMQQHMGC
ncbi:MAG: rhodanese-like domain-containing protein [Nitrospirae bacterium]|nr:rhodanese-like domain-containing protein [Nitrospirota bacterium]